MKTLKHLPPMATDRNDNVHNRVYQGSRGKNGQGWCKGLTGLLCKDLLKLQFHRNLQMQARSTKSGKGFPPRTSLLLAFPPLDLLTLTSVSRLTTRTRLWWCLQVTSISFQLSRVLHPIVLVYKMHLTVRALLAQYVNTCVWQGRLHFIHHKIQ